MTSVELWRGRIGRAIDKASVESLATVEIIEVLDTRSQTGCIAARGTAMRDVMETEYVLMGFASQVDKVDP
ncbi:hypothetical protein Mycsm_01243 [Mycobacterium sp. JS623]|uniref:hypothetical protein n=1 Tax=Mycobacterium sp. JS623 TaxID=212767 RepID=UPI0002A5AB6F|nr:hypothetical protein [Mycobacterium sp. JS623]AGB21662.1 hypothetical protein Mycsm_01243 [Mycobacterium sp. JS623]